MASLPSKFQISKLTNFLSLLAIAVELRIVNQSRNPVHIKHAKLDAGEFSEIPPQNIQPTESIFIKVRNK